MRLFVAVDLDTTLRQRLAEVLARARRLAGERSRLAWVRPERAHVTLHFLGEVASDEASRLASTFSMPYETAPFELALGGIGAFPGRSRPRVLWLGVTRGAGSLGALAGEAGARLVEAGRAIDARPFAAHLTVARVRGSLPVAALRRIEALGAGEIGAARVDRVTLYESRPGVNGPTYVPLASGRCRE